MAPDANQMSFNVITNVVFLKLGGVIPMMIVEMVLMKLFVPPILQDLNVDTTNGLADLEISAFQDQTSFRVNKDKTYISSSGSSCVITPSSPFRAISAATLCL